MWQRRDSNLDLLDSQVSALPAMAAETKYYSIYHIENLRNSLAPRGAMDDNTSSFGKSEKVIADRSILDCKGKLAMRWECP